MKLKKNLSILIPHSEDPFFMIIVVNCLSQNKNIDIYVTSDNKKGIVNKSRVIKNVSYYPKTSNQDEWIENINKELKKFQIDIIMPIDEFGIEALIKKKHIYKQNLVFLPSLESFQIATNKGKLSEHLESKKIPTPKTFLYDKGIKCKLPPLSFPIILKPLEGNGGGQGINLFKDKESFTHFFDNNIINYPYLIQKYIKGYDIDCSVLCKNGDIVAFTIQKGIMNNKNEFAPKIGLEFLYEHDLYIVVKKLMKSLDWSGVAHIDMRYDDSDDKFKVIEINPRFWGSTEASEISGVNFPYLYCLMSLNLDFELPKYEHVKFLNLLGLSKSIRKKRFFLFRLKFIFKNTPIKYYLKDPLPLVYIVTNKIKSIMKIKF